MKYKITFHDRIYEVEVEMTDPMPMQEYQAYALAPAVASVPAAEAAPTAAPTAPVSAGDGECVAAPMPGNILNVCVAAGQVVKEGDVLVILEAMKMENEIVAPKSGTVSQVCAEKGAVVETGAPLVFIR